METNICTFKPYLPTVVVVVFFFSVLSVFQIKSIFLAAL